MLESGEELQCLPTFRGSGKVLGSLPKGGREVVLSCPPSAWLGGWNGSPSVSRWIKGLCDRGSRRMWGGSIEVLYLLQGCTWGAQHCVGQQQNPSVFSGNVWIQHIDMSAWWRVTISCAQFDRGGNEPRVWVVFVFILPLCHQLWPWFSIPGRKVSQPSEHTPLFALRGMALALCFVLLLYYRVL